MCVYGVLGKGRGGELHKLYNTVNTSIKIDSVTCTTVGVGGGMEGRVKRSLRLLYMYTLYTSSK